MQSQAVIALTSKRTVALLHGATLWRAYTLANPNASVAIERRRHIAWRKWLDAFCLNEGVSEMVAANAVGDIASCAYRAAQSVAAYSTIED